MEAATIEAIESDHRAGLALRREVVAGPGNHVDVVMVPPGGEIGVETHEDADETLLVLAGAGEAVVDGECLPVRAGSVVYIPRGASHNVHNRGPATLRLYAVHGARA